VDDNGQPTLFIIYQRAVLVIAFLIRGRVWATDWLCKPPQAPRFFRSRATTIKDANKTVGGILFSGQDAIFFRYCSYFRFLQSLLNWASTNKLAITFA